MRERIFKEHGSADPWHLKQARGAMIEIEFTVQYVKLRHAHTCRRLRATAMRELLAAMRDEGLLPVDQVQELALAYALHQSLQAVLRLSLSDRFDPKVAPPRLLEALVRAAAVALDGEPPPADFARSSDGSLKASARYARSSTSYVHHSPARRPRNQRERP